MYTYLYIDLGDTMNAVAKGAQKQIHEITKTRSVRDWRSYKLRKYVRVEVLAK